MYLSQMAFEVAQRIKKEKLNIIDVRENDEWMDGHIRGAKHIPLGQLPLRTDELDSSKEYIVVCHSGGRSSMACDFLSQQGFKVVNMMGGMSSWPGEVEYV